MTVSSTTNTAGPFACNGAIVDFPFLFPVFNVSDLRVYLVDPVAETSTLLVYGTNYSVTLSPGTGGSVTTVTTYPTGKQILLKRKLPLTQEIDLANQGDWFPETHEEAFDRAVMLIQDVQEQADRALMKDEAGFDFDAKGNKIVNLGTGVASADAVNLAQMQKGDTDTYSAAVSAAYAAMKSWVTTFVTNYWPISTPVSNANMVTPSTQTASAGQTRIYFPVPVHGIVMAWDGGVQAQNKDYIYTAGNNYVDVVGASPFRGGEIITAFIYSSSTGATAFGQNYAIMPAGDTSVTIPGGVFNSAIVAFDSGVQRPVVDYTHVSGTDVISVPAAFPTAIVVHVTRLT